MKKTKFKTEELEFIKKNFNNMPMQDIAKRLDRTLEQVVEKANILGLYGDEDSAFNLEERPYWDQIQKQFNAEELNFFVHQWNQIINQFKGDVFHLEEMQIIDYIRLSIMLNRCYSSIQQSDQDYYEVQDLIEQEKVGENNLAMIQQLTMQKQSIFSSRECVKTEIRDIVKEQKSLLDKLKGTRSERVKSIENSKHSFKAWMKQLIENRELRKQLGINMEKMRLAAHLEYDRLSQPHKYIDGGVDQPLLNHETIGEEDEGRNFWG